MYNCALTGSISVIGFIVYVCFKTRTAHEVCVKTPAKELQKNPRKKLVGNI